MPNLIDRNAQDRSPRTDDSGAEINEEMERRLMLGEKANAPPAAEDRPSQGDTVAGRAAAAPSGRR